MPSLPQSVVRGLWFAPGGWPDGLPSLLRAWWVGSTEHPVPYRLAGPSMDQRPSRLSSLGIHLDGTNHNPLTTLCCHGAVPGLKRPQPPWGSQWHDTRVKWTTFVTPMCHQLVKAGKSDSAASRAVCVRDDASELTGMYWWRVLETALLLSAGSLTKMTNADTPAHSNDELRTN